MKITKKEMPLIMHGVLVVALFCLLIASVAILMNNSVAWFSQNKKVAANGASVSLKDLGINAKYYAKYGKDADYTEITEWAHLFENLMPGDTVSIKAEYTSTEDQPRNLKVLFKAQNETPLTKEITVDTTTTTRYYYFGSQLQIISKTLNGGAAENMNRFLVTPPDNKIYYEAQATPNEIELATLDIANGTYTLEFTVRFENYTDIDQNDYQGFGVTDNSKQDPIESCLWQLVGIVEEK